MSSKNFYGLTGDVTVDGGILNVGNAQLYANTETSNVGVGTSNPEFQLDVHGDANVGVLYSTFLHGDGSNIENIVSSQWEGSPGDPIYYASNVGIANTSPVTATMQIGSNVVIDDVGSNVIHVTGNIYADYLVGDGSQLTGIAASLDQIVDQGNTVSNTIQIEAGQDATSNMGLVTHDGVGISISNTNPTGEFQFGVGSNLLVNVYSSNVLTVDGNVFAQKMTLGTVTITPAYNLQQIMATGATTNQTLVLSNVTTGLTTASNVGIANTAPVHTLDVGSNLYVEDTGSNVLTVTGNAYISGDVNIGSNLYVEDTGSNVLTVTGNAYVTERLDVGSNLHIENLRVAEVAANLVTYDSATGELMDSAGLFSNKLAVVSEQPPVALTGASTVVAKHGTYTIEASSGTVVNLFDKVIEEINKWETDGNYSTDEGTEGDYNGSASLAGYDGEWVKITMPYKTILRHVKIESTNQSVEDIKLVGLNSDGLTWSVLKTVTGLTGTTHTIIVNATTHHKTYGLIVEKTNTTTGRSAVEIGDLKLFTESFSIDGGKVEMATSMVMGGETTMDQHGPHERGEAKLKKYPEIIFEEGKFDRNDSTNTYTQAGYTVTASSQRTDDKNAANLYEDNFPVTSQNDTWQTLTNIYDVNGDATSDYALTGITGGVGSRNGSYTTLELPHKIQLSYIQIQTRNSDDFGSPIHPKQIYLYGSNDGSSWTQVGSHLFTSIPTSPVWQRIDINSTTPYNYFALQVTSVLNNEARTSICQLRYYGYEELATQGDTSIDTTFTSIMNTPQTTGAQVYVDGSLGETFTNRVTGPTVSNTHTTYVSAEKYWELSGNVESNVTIEANTFLEGDQPHSVSVWFNSSNLEANVSNTCVFSISDQEKLDSLNLDLQSNTWHNLTYAYQGEGGSRVTYLDGRKVAEDQAEDTFGDYPPFAMTGYSQGGYVVSASDEEPSYNAWKAFEDLNTNTDAWSTDFIENRYDVSTGEATINTPLFEGERGDWIQIQLPHKFKLDYVLIDPRRVASPKTPEASPGDGRIFGSTDGTNWTLITSFSGRKYGGDASNENATAETILTSTNAYYSYYRLQVTKRAGQYGTDKYVAIGQLKFYGHRENDLVRLPDPTNVLKYPHINSGISTASAVSYPAVSGINGLFGVHSIRGYVFKASSSIASYPVSSAFNGDTSSATGSRWASGTSTYGTGGVYPNSGLAANQIRTLSSDLGGPAEGATGGTVKGEWLYIEMPHKVKATSMKIVSHPYVGEQPKNIIIYGSNDLTTGWTIVDNTYVSTSIAVPLNTTGKTWTVSTASNPVAYKYFALVTTKTDYTGGVVGLVVINDWSIYGTEEATPVPIQIGGGNIDKVANFRVYDKFIDENQALEIWDAQKDAFGRAKSSMTLHKGRLGIGTTEPEGRLAVVDEPHAPEEFPPRAMTGYETYMEGHGVFKASASSYYSSGYEGWRVFDEYTNSNGTNDPSGRWTALNSTSTIGSITGKWVKLELPYRVNFSKIGIFPPSYSGGSTQCPTGFSIIASNDDETWTTIKTLSNYTWTEFAYNYITFENDGYFKYVAIVATTDGGSVNTSFQELRYFGTREQGQSVLHDGQLTLTKSLTVPRIGPALDADDTPRRDRLLVEYNTSTNPTFEGAVRDTSGRGNDGVFYGGASYDATEKALVFDGTDDITEIDLGKEVFKNSSVHTTSLWVKMNRHTSDAQTFFSLGNGGDYTAGVLKHANLYHTTNHGLRLSFTHHDYRLGEVVPIGQWVHVAYTYDGTTWQNTTTPTNVNIYINGVKVAINSVYTVGGGPYTTDSSLDLSVAQLALGAASTSSDTRDYSGVDISQFKLYDTVLTASEVKTLYDMGRCDEGHHVVNFSKTRVGIGLGDGEVPRVALDVRGDIVSSGIIGPQARASATTFYNLGYRGTGFYPIRGRAPTSGGLGPEGDIYNIYCNMDPNWYGGKWMCFARLNQNQNFDQQNIFTRSVVGDPSNLGSSFTVPISIMAPDNIGYDLEVMLTVHGGGGASSVGPWRSDFGGRVGGIWTGISLNNAFDETRGDDGNGPNTSNPRVSDDGINYTSVTGALMASVGWAFTISTASGTGSYQDSNKGTSGWILHENGNNGHTYSIYAKVYAPNDGGSSGGETLGNYTDWDYVHVWIRAPE